MMNFVEELRWRGMLHDIMPETEEYLLKNKTIGYVGFDPTADSLHIGSLVPIILLMHFQKSGNTPIALVGGATGMVGDPSGKSDERNLLDEETLHKNIAIFLVTKSSSSIITLTIPSKMCSPSFVSFFCFNFLLISIIKF